MRAHPVSLLLLTTAFLIIAAIALWSLRPPLPDDPSRAIIKSGDIETVVVFGTSLSAGPYTWPDDLGTCLGSSIIRLARAGASSDWALAHVDRVIAARPDLVIMEFAINDADMMDGLSTAQSHKNHVQILRRIRRDLPDTQIVLMTTNPVTGLNVLKRYQLGRYFRLYSSLSSQFDTGLIHMHPYWRDIPLPDGLHPRNHDASAVIVPQLLNIISSKHCASDG